MESRTRWNYFVYYYTKLARISSWSQISPDLNLKTVFSLMFLIPRAHLREQWTTDADCCGLLASDRYGPCISSFPITDICTWDWSTGKPYMHSYCLKSTLPSKVQSHSLLHLSAFINLPICLLVLFRLQVIVTKYMKTVTKDSLCLT